MMREPTQAEVDVVEVAMRAYNRVSIFTPRDRARAAIQALDKLRGPCVPVDALKAKIDTLRDFEKPSLVVRLLAWLDRKGWIDE